MGRAKRQATRRPGVYSRTLTGGRRVYDIAYWVAEGGGRKKRWESGFTTLQEATARRDQVRTDLRLGSYVAPSEVVFGDYARARLERRFATKAIRESSYSTDLRLLNTHLSPKIADLPIQRVTSRDLNELYAHLATDGRRDGREGGLSPRTIERLHVLISQTLKEAMAEGLVPRNVAGPTTRPRRSRRTVVALSADEVRRLLETAKDDWFYPLVFLAVTTGMRRGELCGLTWSHVDLDRGEVRVEKALVSVDHRPVWSTAKTDVGHRTVPLDRRSVDVLREHRRRLAEARLLLGSVWKDDLDLVFPNPDGSLYNPEVISMRLGRLLKKAGLPHYSLHALRHTYATLARRQGMDVKVLSERLGHSTVTITMDLYQHVPQDMAKQAAHDVAEYILGQA